MKNKLKQFLLVSSLLILSGFTSWSHSYCTPTTDCGIKITSITLTGENGNNINNSSACSNGGYTDYSNLYAELKTGLIYQGTAMVDPGTSTAAKIYIWIDWNEDGDFLDADEFVYNGALQSGSQSTVTFTLNVPITAIGVPTMRVRTNEDTGSPFEACTNSTTGETEDYSILVVQGNPPNCLINPWPADGATGVCVSTINLTYDVDTSGDEAYSFNNLLGNTPTLTQVSTGTPFTVSLQPNTTYYWQVQASNGNGTAQNCPIWSFTTTDLATDISPNPAEVCQGADLQLTGNVSGTSTGPFTYSWSIQDSSSLSSFNTQSTTFNSPTAGTFSLSFIVENSDGCVASAWKNINVLPEKTVSVSIATTIGNNPGCAGQSLAFSPTATNGGTAPAYDWRVNGMSMSTNSTFVSSTLSDQDVVDLLLTSNEECPDNLVVNSNAITISHVAMVPASINISLAQSSYCKGETLNFSLSSQNGGSNPVYEWFINGISAGLGSTFDVANLNNGQVVKCEMTSSLACVSASPAISNTITIQNVTPVDPKVAIGIIQGQNPSCEGDFILFEASPTYGGPNPIFEWYLNGVFQSSGPTFGSSTLVTGDELFSIMTSDEYCLTQNSVQSLTVELTVFPIISKPTITQDNDLLISSAPSDNQWVFNGADIPGATAQSLQITQNGLYSVRVNDQYCPSEYSDSWNITNAGLETLKKSGHVLISPNPSTGIYHIQTSENMFGELKVFNVLGAEIMTKSVNTSSSTIDLSRMKSGVYIMLFETNCGKFTSRLIKK